ncbi:hypothetical protein [Roseiconus lacunae]|uniref:hypothetical protein n=1 Tax=Roseiconus lacunae TaxID=2605694 RepID=UPI001E575970|nr:hypothetical protein [Roseiconus lacunae]MCD0458653.1 hypothetical protein [Roseiconus lacunae]
MDQQIASKNEANRLDRVPGEDQFLEQLSKIWLPHQRKDLQVRFQLGQLLNKELGPPKDRQNYGVATINRVSDELEIDRSDIYRLRRFAAMSDSLDEFLKEYPDATNWTRVRELLSQLSDRQKPANDSRVTSGLLRSAKSMVKTLESTDQDFGGSKADEEIRPVLSRLFQLAKARWDI